MKATNLYTATEDEEQAAVVEWCELFHVPVVHVPNEGKRTEAYAARLKRLGLQPGFPDLFVPAARGGYHGLMIEMKTERGRLTADQKRWLAQLNAAGYRAVMCRGADEAICEIQNYLRGAKKS